MNQQDLEGNESKANHGSMLLREDFEGSISSLSFDENLPIPDLPEGMPSSVADRSKKGLALTEPVTSYKKQKVEGRFGLNGLSKTDLKQQPTVDASPAAGTTNTLRRNPKLEEMMSTSGTQNFVWSSSTPPSSQRTARNLFLSRNKQNIANELPQKLATKQVTNQTTSTTSW